MLLMLLLRMGEGFLLAFYSYLRYIEILDNLTFSTNEKSNKNLARMCRFSDVLLTSGHRPNK